LNEFLQALVNTIMLGGFYALMVMGFSLIWGVMGVINLSHGEFVIVGAYLTWLMNRHLGWEPFATLIVVIPVMFAFGYLLHRLLINRIVDRPPLVSLLVTFGLAIVTANTLKLAFTGTPRSVSTALGGYWQVAELTIPVVKTYDLLLALVMMAALSLLLGRTRLGKSIRASAQNRQAARMVGIKIGSVFAITFGIGVALTGAAGTLFSLTQPVAPFAGLALTLRAFAITTMAGLGNIRGALLGSMALAAVEIYIGTYVPRVGTNLGLVAAFVVLVVILITRPQGLFGGLTPVDDGAAIANLRLAVVRPLIVAGRRWGIVILVGVLALLPVISAVNDGEGLINNSTLFSMTQMLMLVTLASNWNFISGLTGYIDFGHVAFFGLGAYSTGILMSKAGWPFFPTLAVGAVIAAVAAMLIGRATMHLKGPYFSIAMLGTFAALREIARVTRFLTGGGPGLTLPPYLNRSLFFYLALAQAVIVVALYRWLKATEFGSMMQGIREDEPGADMRGINTTATKITAFGLAALSTGVVGGMWAYQNTFIDPDIVFLDSRMIEIAIAAVLGGLGTIAGPVLGGGLLYWMRDVVWANFLQWHLIVEGLVLIGIVLLLPNGVMGLLRDRSGLDVRRVWARRRAR
jgi:branched-subunit amino acid ABC-type transport system permease component